MAAARRLGPYTVATHTKDLDACRHVRPEEWYFFSSVPVGTGLIDMPGVVRALKESGYEGVLAVESDHHKDNQDEDQLVADSIAYLKQLLAELEGLTPYQRGAGHEETQCRPDRLQVHGQGAQLRPVGHTVLLQDGHRPGAQGAGRPPCGPAPSRRPEDFGWEEYATDWREVVRRPDIDVVDIATPPNTHAEIAIAAAEAGKHIFCEKPFTVTVDEAERALAAVAAGWCQAHARVQLPPRPGHRSGQAPDRVGRLGKIFHFRAAYLQDWIMDPQFPRIWKLNRAIAGSGPHHELNSHIIDLALYLVGKIDRVVGMEETFIKQRPAEAEAEQLSTMLTAQASTSKMVDVDVDDTTAFLARFADGAVGTFESTRFAAGRRNHNRIEVNGSKGSVYFDLENMNLLEYYNADDPIRRAGLPHHPGQ